ncbi:MAG TPA: MBG domain-containing protein [Candidatus Kapabacteria bacterium]|nr:MBG domain-containing protein [Candidatus Kapabacteria bacterium]
MSSDTTRCRTRSSALRSRCMRAVALFALAAVTPTIAGAQSAGLAGGSHHALSDTIGTTGTVRSAPAFTEHPRDVATTAFVDARFSVAYSGQPLPSVSWQFSTDGASWNDVPGATTAALVVRSPVVAHDGTHWRARLNAPGAEPLFSNAARLSVEKAPATIRVDALTQTYDGTRRSVVVTTVPAGLRVNVTYLRDGVPVADPVEPDTYEVLIEVAGSNHAGTARATLTIEPR